MITKCQNEKQEPRVKADGATALGSVVMVTLNGRAGDTIPVYLIWLSLAPQSLPLGNLIFSAQVSQNKLLWNILYQYSRLMVSSVSDDI